MPKKSKNRAAKKAAQKRAQRRLGMIKADLMGFKGSLSWGKHSKRRMQMAPAAVSTAVAGGRPQISRSDGRSVRIVHRELVGSVDLTEGFTVVKAMSLNPGLSDVFPWLSTEALGYERYRFNKLRVCYYARCASSTGGSVLVACDYDGKATTPTSDDQMGSFLGSIEDAPWKSMIFEADHASMQGGYKDKYIRQANFQGFDSRATDSGVIYIATSGGTTPPSRVGKLWVEYDVTLLTPHVKSPSTIVHPHQVFLYSNSNQSNRNDFLGVTQEPVTAVGGLQVSYDLPNTLTFKEPSHYAVYFRCGPTAISNTIWHTGNPQYTIPVLDGAAGGGYAVGETVNGGDSALLGYSALVLVNTIRPNASLLTTFTNMTGTDPWGTQPVANIFVCRISEQTYKQLGGPPPHDNSKAKLLNIIDKFAKVGIDSPQPKIPESWYTTSQDDEEPEVVDPPRNARRR